MNRAAKERVTNERVDGNHEPAHRRHTQRECRGGQVARSATPVPPSRAAVRSYPAATGRTARWTRYAGRPRASAIGCVGASLARTTAVSNLLDRRRASAVRAEKMPSSGSPPEPASARGEPFDAAGTARLVCKAKMNRSRHLRAASPPPDARLRRQLVVERDDDCVFARKIAIQQSDADTSFFRDIQAWSPHIRASQSAEWRWHTGDPRRGTLCALARRWPLSQLDLY